MILWGFVALLVAGGIFSFLYRTPEKQQKNTDVSALLEITSADHAKGSAKASVTLIEYGDFQCPTCLSYYPFVTQLMREFPTMLRVVFRDFPITTVHANAKAAAGAAGAAGKQGKFWEMHNALFDNQGTWAKERDPEALFTSYAKQIRLDTDRFITDMHSASVDDKIKQDQDSGTALGVRGTPTFFLNGQEIENPKDYKDFKTLIETALLKTPVHKN